MDLRDKSRGAQKQAIFHKCNAKAATIYVHFNKRYINAGLT